MPSENMNFTRWPHPAATALPREDLGTEKVSQVLYEELTPEYLIRGIVSDASFGDELPPGIEKVAARRFGMDDSLPTVTPKNIWRHPNAHPLALMLILLDRYGQPYAEWEPETLRTQMKKDDILISDSVWTKILAGRVLLMSGSPWRRWEQFHWVITGLAGRPPNFVYLELPEIGFIMSGVDSMKMVDKTRPFAEEITKYVATVLRERGVMYAPPPIEFAQEELNDRRILCKQCGTEEKDDHDIKCVACGSSDLEHLPGHFEEFLGKPMEEIFKKRRTKALEGAVDGLGEDAASQGAYRLLVHNEYRNQVRAQLVQQLNMLKSAG